MTGPALARGRRTADETPDVIDAAQLSDLERRSQSALRQLVEKAGGRWGIGGRQIEVDHVELLADRFEEWAHRHSKLDSEERLVFSGVPGFWHALDELYPLQDPNRWDHLRLAVTRQLEVRGWCRIGSSPRSMRWRAPE